MRESALSPQAGTEVVDITASQSSATWSRVWRGTEDWPVPSAAEAGLQQLEPPTRASWYKRAASNPVLDGDRAGTAGFCKAALHLQNPSHGGISCSLSITAGAEGHKSSLVAPRIWLPDFSHCGGSLGSKAQTQACQFSLPLSYIGLPSPSHFHNNSWMFGESTACCLPGCPPRGHGGWGNVGKWVQWSQEECGI